MAVRGVVSQLWFFDPETFDTAYNLQNYFINGRDLMGFGEVSDYCNFQVSPIATSSTSAKQSFSAVFAGTASNIELVEDAIERRLLVNFVIWRWSDTEGLENPSSFNEFGSAFAQAASGSSNFTTITLQCETYSKTANADFPGKKVPWQILAPLSLRRT